MRPPTDCRFARTPVVLQPFLTLLLAAGLAGVLAVTLAACGGEGEEAAAGPARAGAGGAPGAAQAAVSDSAGGDSLRAAEPDSAAQVAAGGFLQRLFGGGEGEEEEEEEEAIPVEVVDVTLGDIPSYLTSTATLEPEKDAVILAKTDGELLELRVEEGDWVTSGQLLAVLDGATQQVALDEARARLHAVERELERVRALHEQELASDKDLHDVQAEFEQAHALAQGAQLRVAHTRVAAPFAGRITERFVDRGQTVATGGELYALVDPDPLLARVYLPEREALKVSPGQPVRVVPDTDPSVAFDGEVLRIAPIVDARTGTVKVTCRVAEEETRLLRPGSFVRVRVETDVHRNVLVIPKRSLVPEGAQPYVFKAVADSAVKIPVATGYSGEELVEVLEGVAVGERVVTVGHGGLKTGSKIRVITAEPIAVAAADSGDAD